VKSLYLSMLASWVLTRTMVGSSSSKVIMTSITFFSFILFFPWCKDQGALLWLSLKQSSSSCMTFLQWPNFFNLSKVDSFFPFEEVMDVDGVNVTFVLAFPYETIETLLWDTMFEESLYTSWRFGKENITDSCLKLCSINWGSLAQNHVTRDRLWLSR